MTDPCAKQKQKVADLQDKVADLKDQIQNATGQALHNAAQALGIATTQLAAAQLALQKCEGITPPAPVQPKPITIGVGGIECINATSGLGSDEPYVLVLAVDLSSTLSLSVGGKTVSVPLPSLHVTRVGPWEDVDDGETHSVFELAPADRQPFWDLTGTLKLTDPAKTIFLVTLMENDDADPESIRTTVTGIMAGNLFSNPTLNRDTLASMLRGALDGAINTARGAGATFPFNFDDQIGSTQELRISAADIATASKNGSTELFLSEFNGDGASYSIIFTMSTSPLN